MESRAMEQTFKSEKQKMTEEMKYWRNTKWLVVAISIAAAIVSIYLLEASFIWAILSAISSIACLAGFISIVRINKTLEKRLLWLQQLEENEQVPAGLKALYDQLISQKAIASHHAIEYKSLQHHIRITESMFYRNMDDL
ncbi:MAG: hypothetical protein COU51_04520 [Parcubacteria group bacterium CG10_big_fil_rev_8_21_14_0_10_36_14]|nr:MAG: hypothetical protein COU51_04520 [Parcubacteria group bacterium CG10_big_fil_rev_8_21_14_0_10_36_14]